MKTDLEIQSRIAKINGEVHQIKSELIIVSNTSGGDNPYVKGREIRIAVLEAEVRGLEWARS